MRKPWGKIRLGVVGVYRGSSMINYCKRADHAEVVAICDKSPEALDAQREAAAGLNITFYDHFDKFIEHDMDIVFNYADEISVLRDGELIATGTPEEIFMQADQLTRMGLDVPQVCQLGALLRKSGIDFPENVYREEQALEALLTLLGKGAESDAE